MGRPVYKSPPGRMTLAQAAKHAGISYHTAYAKVVGGQLAAFERDRGVITIARADWKLLRPAAKPEPKDPRPAVVNRVSPERYAAWERAASGRPVREWIAELADQVSGYVTGRPR